MLKDFVQHYYIFRLFCVKLKSFDFLGINLKVIYIT